MEVTKVGTQQSKSLLQTGWIRVVYSDKPLFGNAFVFASITGLAVSRGFGCVLSLPLNWSGLIRRIGLTARMRDRFGTY